MATLEVAKAPVLLVGVFSWDSREGERRRQSIRELLPIDPRALLRFVMTVSGADASRGDVWSFPLPRDAQSRSKLIGKFVLANAFLRHAATLQHKFVLRTDDDAVFNTSAVIDQLLLLPSAMRFLVYGASHEW